jgi:DNA-binding transcriptional MerR regulator
MLNSYSIGDLANKTGVTRRGIRFYVQREMLHPPKGKGRGSYYDTSHVERLTQIQQLQDAGHSLENIRLILNGKLDEAQAEPVHKPGRTIQASCWSRYPIAPGYELHIDTSKDLPTREQLEEIRKILS